MTPEERDYIEDLLQDETLSFREIGRRTGFSDFTIRAAARKVAGDPRPLKSPRSRSDDSDDEGESLGLGGWAVLAGITGLFIGAIWLWGRNMGPPDV
jgi:hypothetical protein